ncbi:hypothetical protein EX30DRAFT_310595 [Ascodesmis nigricans]|uniref:Superoxide dismutase n=1 Tax=Ascodesmis nigricans TaxID=341454 RepID=A0A4S2MLX5_9PEZI|nr:hypothetical protein EX30DRAFT_310595 [Ascodesmis nigricans]
MKTLLLPLTLLLTLASATPIADPTATLHTPDLHRRQATTTSSSPTSTPSAYALPTLPYGLSDLEPHISREIVETHHTKHHATFISNMNLAVRDLQSGNITNIANILSSFRYNAGAHINHSLFWLSLAKTNSTQAMATPSREREALSSLTGQILSQWGSYDAMWEALVEKAKELTGSGWVWLVRGPGNLNTVEVKLTTDQTPMMDPWTPIFCIDLWEHAYYPQYKNDKMAYLRSIKNIINWDEAEKRYSKTKLSPVVGTEW